jgi:hypothetical protein
MLSSEFPITAILKLVNFRLINVLIKVIQFGCKDSKTTYSKTLKHILEDLHIETSVVNHRGSDNEFKSVMVRLRNLYILLTKYKSFQLFVGFLLLGD